MEWKKFNGELIGTSIIEEVERTIIKEIESGVKIRICIGTDSQVYGNITEFATVIVFIRPKNGGFMYINTEKSKINLTIKERMLKEVAMSIAIAYEILPVLELYQIDLEVHADINTSPMYKSNTALSEAMGYTKGMGFEFKSKPNAFASSYCANKMVH